MTKETKIGLLVGLTFIILFAIILSEKGASTTIKAPTQLAQADGSRMGSDRPAPDAAPLAGSGRFPVENGLRPSAAESAPPQQPSAIVMLEEPVDGQPIPTDPSQIGPIPPEVRDRLNMARIETEVPIQVPPPASEPGTMSAIDAVALATGRTPSTTAEEQVPIDVDAAIDTASSTTVSHLTEPSPAQRPPEPPKPMRVKAVHKVEPGESLGKIAARYYGRSTPQRVEAIFNANRDSLKSVNAVRANLKLNIPELDANGEIEFEPAESFSVARINSGDARRVEEGTRIPIPADDRPLAPRRTTNAPATAPTNAVVSASGESRRPTPPASTTPPASNSLRSQSPTPQPGQFVWYEVKERDTLSKIARHQLGSERFVGKLFDLNRDILKSKHQLKVGCKIRIPAKPETGINPAAPDVMASMTSETMTSP